jgi:hypothetical protein
MSNKIKVFISADSNQLAKLTLSGLLGEQVESTDAPQGAALFVKVGSTYDELTATGSTSVSAGDGVAAGRDISGTVDNSRRNSNINIGGNINAGIANLGGEMTVNGGVNIDMSSSTKAIEESESIPPENKESIKKVVSDFQAELAKVPVNNNADVAEALEATKELTDEMVEDAAKPKRNWLKLEIKGENLKKATDALVGVAPQVKTLALGVVMEIAKLKAMGL